MTAFALYVLDMNQIKTPEEYNETTRKPPFRYFDKLRDVEAYCGAGLRRMNGAYCGTKDNTEYIAYKVTF